MICSIIIFLACFKISQMKIVECFCRLIKYPVNFHLINHFSISFWWQNWYFFWFCFGLWFTFYFFQSFVFKLEWNRWKVIIDVTFNKFTYNFLICFALASTFTDTLQSNLLINRFSIWSIRINYLRFDLSNGNIELVPRISCSS